MLVLFSWIGFRFSEFDKDFWIKRFNMSNEVILFDKDDRDSYSVYLFLRKVNFKIYSIFKSLLKWNNVLRSEIGININTNP